MSIVSLIPNFLAFLFGERVPIKGISPLVGNNGTRYSFGRIFAKGAPSRVLLE